MKGESMFIKQNIRYLLASLLALSLTAGSACNRPPIARTWVNPQAKIHEVSKIEIYYNCGEKPIKAYDPLSAALWVIKTYVRCARTDCTWGRAKGLSKKDGSLEATYSTFLAWRNVHIVDEGGLIRAGVQIKYRDSERPSEAMTYYLQPEQ